MHHKTIETKTPTIKSKPRSVMKTDPPQNPIKTATTGGGLRENQNRTKKNNKPKPIEHGQKRRCRTIPRWCGGPRRSTHHHRPHLHGEEKIWIVKDGDLKKGREAAMKL
jgi:hypothetical protein